MSDLVPPSAGTGAHAPRGLSWLRLSLPAQPQAIAVVQSALRAQARPWGFTPGDLQRMELATEETILTILRLTHGDDGATASAANAGVFDIDITLVPPALQLRITDHDLPYDLSLVPEFSPVDAGSAADDTAGLSAFLMRQMTDVCRVLNPGYHGQSVELEWFLPTGVAPAQAAAVPAAAQAPEGALRIDALQDADAIQLARLMYRNYGYSYVNTALYAPEQIRERVQDGRLTSWVARIEGEQELVGHFALMKQQAGDRVVEIGAGAVSPRVQGRGVFGKLLAQIEAALVHRPEDACCVHAVTCHPFTQKTVLHHGYEPCALLLAYTPATLQFRSVAGQSGEERGGVYYHCKLLKPQPPIHAHIPDEVRALVLSAAQRVGLPLQPVDGPGDAGEATALDDQTRLSLDIEPALNAAFMELHEWGEDGEPVLQRQVRQLCRQRLDAVYLSIDLQRAHVRTAWPALRRLGFIPAGLAPFVPGPAAFLLQYLNNQALNPDGVHAVGDAAQAIKAQVITAYQVQESL